MARVEDARADYFCATHGGAIGSFAALSARIKDPTELVPLLQQRDDRNYVDTLKTAAWTVPALLAAFPLALVAAPAVGGAIGVGVLGLKGAAATSAGLAWLGFGSLASGGAGMAGGMALLTAVGGALGGTYGGVIANRYFSDVNGFTIEKIRDGKDPALICVDGFLTEGTDTIADWLNGLGSTYEGHAVYRVQWESKTLHELSSFVFKALDIGPGLSLRERALSAITVLAQSASKTAAAKLGVVAGVLPAATLAGNPWWVAMHKSHKAGVLIAETISRCENRTFILIGHSLGARAVVSALHILATREMSGRSSRIRDVHLLGGAVDIGDADQWRIVTDAIEGKCYNYYTDTKNDWILTWLYRAANLGLSTPIGLSSLPTSDYTKEKLISIDCSQEVEGHSEYHASLGRILQVEKTKPARRGFWSWIFGQKSSLLQINTAHSPALRARDSSTFR